MAFIDKMSAKLQRAS